jgi:3-dehydroquinate dehydratase-2
MRIAIINGPNLNLLGSRQPEIYGEQTFEQYLEKLKVEFPDVEFNYYQSNIEGELVNAIQQLSGKNEAIILNAAAYTHTSVALGDAVAAVAVPVIEIHISNVQARESFRHHSYIAKHTRGVISGFGMQGYALAVQSVLAQQ